MKFCFLRWSIFFLAPILLAPAADITLQQAYLDAFLKEEDAERLDKNGNTALALSELEDTYAKLKKIHDDYPHWEPALVKGRMDDCRARIRALQSKVQPSTITVSKAGNQVDPHATLQQQYLDIYLRLNDGQRLEQSGDLAGALARFQDCYRRLSDLQKSDPDFETVLIGERLGDSRAKIIEVERKAFVQAEKEKAASAALASASLKNKSHARTYPWKTNIVATVFRIGEGTRTVGDWDPSTTNSFYVALPFNDLTNPKMAREWLPASWSKPAREGKTVSACQHRWVEIKNSEGAVCYAQWEDVGPDHSNSASYVFGAERPGKKSAGLGVAPAVGQFLGIDQTGKTSWRFVDDSDVRSGPWLNSGAQIAGSNQKPVMPSPVGENVIPTTNAP
jgi:hypothetical protein